MDAYRRHNLLPLPCTGFLQCPANGNPAQSDNVTPAQGCARGAAGCMSRESPWGSPCGFLTPATPAPALRSRHGPLSLFHCVCGCIPYAPCPLVLWRVLFPRRQPPLAAPSRAPSYPPVSHTRPGNCRSLYSRRLAQRSLFLTLCCSVPRSSDAPPLLPLPRCRLTARGSPSFEFGPPEAGAGVRGDSALRQLHP